MIRIEEDRERIFHPKADGDPLQVEKGYCHFRQEGQKDFLSRITAYEPLEDGVKFEVLTFRGRKALVQVGFVSETAFRFQMIPALSEGCRKNEVFCFRPSAGISAEKQGDVVVVSSGRMKLTFRVWPWEMTVELDGRELTREQIRDLNVDQKYKAVPTGFTVGADGKVSDAFETMYLYCDETFYGFGEKFTGFNKRGQKITIWQRDAQSTNSDISYKGMPYLMSSQGYSILLNTYTRSHFNIRRYPILSKRRTLIWTITFSATGIIRDFWKITRPSPAALP